MRGYFYIPSVETMKERDLVDFKRMSFTSFWAGESFQAFALSTLSNAMMMNRLGGAPSSAVIFSVRAIKRPSNAARAGGALGRSALNPSGSLMSVMSTTT